MQWVSAKVNFISRFGYGFAIIMEDIGGVSIKQLLPARGFSIADFYPIAIDIGKYPIII